MQYQVKLTTPNLSTPVIITDHHLGQTITPNSIKVPFILGRPNGIISFPKTEFPIDKELTPFRRKSVDDIFFPPADRNPSVNRYNKLFNPQERDQRRTGCGRR